jgi:hypothetical protein
MDDGIVSFALPRRKRDGKAPKPEPVVTASAAPPAAASATPRRLTDITNTPQSLSSKSTIKKPVFFPDSAGSMASTGGSASVGAGLCHVQHASVAPPPPGPLPSTPHPQVVMRATLLNPLLQVVEGAEGSSVSPAIRDFGCPQAPTSSSTGTSPAAAAAQPTAADGTSATPSVPSPRSTVDAVGAVDAVDAVDGVGAVDAVDAVDTAQVVAALVAPAVVSVASAPTALEPSEHDPKYSEAEMEVMLRAARKEGAAASLADQERAMAAKLEDEKIRLAAMWRTDLEVCKCNVM